MTTITAQLSQSFHRRHCFLHVDKAFFATVAGSFPLSVMILRETDADQDVGSATAHGFIPKSVEFMLGHSFDELLKQFLQMESWR